MFAFSLRNLLQSAANLPWTPATNTENISALITLHTYHSKQKFRQFFLQDYYDERISELKTFFQEQGFEVADAAFDVLLDLKKGKIRKNGYAPGHAHEIDQLLPIMDLVKNGSFSKEDLAEIERQHGSLEHWFCTVIVHDIGEDYGYFGTDLADAIETKLNDKHIQKTSYHDDMTRLTVEGMEVLTHDRRFSYQEICDLLEDNISLPNVKGHKTVELPQLNNFFKNKIGLLNLPMKNLKVFARYDDRKQEPEIIVTRYGAINQNGRHITEWNVYIQALLSKHLYYALSKMNDRVTGMVTRPFIDKDDPVAFARYISHTSNLFNISGAAHMIATDLYPNSPLVKCAHSIADMMKIAQRAGRLYLSHHAQYDAEGRKGFSEANLSYNAAATDGKSILHISDSFPSAMEFYRFNDKHKTSHPLTAMMRDYCDCLEPDFSGKRTGLYFIIEDALLENDVNGDIDAIVTHNEAWGTQNYWEYNTSQEEEADMSLDG